MRALGKATRPSGAPLAQNVFIVGKHRHKETTFESVWSSDQTYVQWCVSRVSDKPGTNQSDWLRFIATRFTATEPVPELAYTAASSSIPAEPYPTHIEHRVNVLETVVYELLDHMRHV